MNAKPNLHTLGLTDLQTAAGIEKLGEALIQHGAFILTNPGIPRGLIEGIYTEGKYFFQEQPVEYKMQFAMPDDGYYSSYSPLRSEQAVAFDGQPRAHADEKEFLNARQEREDAAYLLPPALKPYFTPFLQWSNTLNLVATRTLEKYFGVTTGEMTELVENGDHLARFIHYPRRTTNREGRPAAPHYDINWLTYLWRSDNQVPGLHILTHAGETIAVDNPPGSCVVQSGLMLAANTNNVIQPTKHWVTEQDKARFMLACFGHPRHEAVLCQRGGQPLTAGEYLKEVLQAINVSPVS